jgi:hypothetical protein
MLPDSSTREIPLTKGYVALVDEADYDMLSRFKWHAHFSGKTIYAARLCGGRNRQTFVYLHRMVMLPDPGQEIDHINHNTLDNRRANLRLCSRGENASNLRRSTRNTSGFKGVSWDRSKQKWEANIVQRGKQHFLGYFPTLESAAHAYNVAATEHFGDFAFTNERT